MSNADALSRLPLPEVPESVPMPGELLILTTYLAESAPVTATDIKAMTDKDTQLARVRQLVQFGWTETCPSPELQPYFNRRQELSVLAGCVVWGSRVVVPPQGREALLTQHNSMTHIRVS